MVTDREGDESRKIPMNRAPSWLPWIAMGAGIAGAAVYYGGLVWGPPLAVSVFVGVLLCAGAWAPNLAPGAALAMIGWARKRPNLMVFGLGTVIVISATGAMLRRRELAGLAAEAQKCATARWDTQRHLKTGDLRIARIRLTDAEAHCGPAERPEVDGLERRIQAAEDAAQQKVAAAHQAARESVAVETFPERAAAARALLKKAQALVVKGDLPAATAEYSRADDILGEFKGTSVEKAPEYTTLRADADKVLQAVRPYIDEVETAVEELRRQVAAQAEQDRRDGVKLTKEGHIAANSREKLEQAIRYARAKDTEGFGLLLEKDPDVTIMKAGVRVVVIERVGIVAPVVRARIRGTLDEFWTVPDALRDP